MASAEPSDATVHRIHDRYLLEVVEGLGLCPFSRRSREAGRVQRPLLRATPHGFDAELAAMRVRETVEKHPSVEIILLTFVDLAGHFADVTVFEGFTAQVRQTYQAYQGSPAEFFMVAFHPDSGRDLPTDRPLNQDMLVQLIRRSPDPVIQCVNAEVLDRARRQAQRAAHQRLLASVQHDPRLVAMIERSVQTDSELSAEIARNNFAAVGRGLGRERLESTLREIAADRAASYGNGV